MLVVLSESSLQIAALAVEAAARLGVRLLAVDIGQLVSGEWIIIETAMPGIVNLTFATATSAAHVKLKL